MAYDKDQYASASREDNLTRSIENQTSKIPSMGFMSLAIGSMALSAFLQFGMKRREVSNFVGLWAPTILIMGLYNKLVKFEKEQASFLKH